MWHISVHGRDITDSQRPVGDALEDQKTMNAAALIATIRGAFGTQA
jgi:hypothetical protein